MSSNHEERGIPNKLVQYMLSSLGLSFREDDSGR